MAVLLLATGTVLAANDDAELKQLRARIESVRARIEADAQRRDSLAREVRSVELAVQTARERVAEIRSQRQSSEQRLAQLHRERLATERRIAAERGALAADVRVAYMMGGKEPLLLLLNEQSPADALRMNTYHRYFARARAERIREIADKLAHLDLLAERATEAMQQLRELEAAHTRETDKLQSARRQRAQTLAAVQTRIRSRSDQAANLERQAKALERLIEEAQRAARDVPLPARGFARAIGKLPWPINGQVVAKFGELRAGGPLRWEGLLIAASPGSEVRALFHGRVVYADHLYGLGLVVMIDHGDGYSSIYGHQEQLYRNVGDTVEQGTVLGVLAERGEGSRSELHLEIRKGKQALDPRQWLRKP